MMLPHPETSLISCFWRKTLLPASTRLQQAHSSALLAQKHFPGRSDWSPAWNRSQEQNEAVGVSLLGLVVLRLFLSPFNLIYEVASVSNSFFLVWIYCHCTCLKRRANKTAIWRLKGWLVWLCVTLIKTMSCNSQLYSVNCNRALCSC